MKVVLWSGVVAELAAIVLLGLGAYMLVTRRSVTRAFQNQPVQAGRSFMLMGLSLALGAGGQIIGQLAVPKWIPLLFAAAALTLAVLYLALVLRRRSMIE